MDSRGGGGAYYYLSFITLVSGCRNDVTWQRHSWEGHSNKHFINNWYDWYVCVCARVSPCVRACVHVSWVSRVSRARVHLVSSAGRAYVSLRQQSFWSFPRFTVASSGSAFQLHTYHPANNRMSSSTSRRNHRNNDFFDFFLFYYWATNQRWRCTAPPTVRDVIQRVDVTVSKISSLSNERFVWMWCCVTLNENHLRLFLNLQSVFTTFEVMFLFLILPVLEEHHVHCCLVASDVCQCLRCCRRLVKSSVRLS